MSYLTLVFSIHFSLLPTAVHLGLQGKSVGLYPNAVPTPILVPFRE